MFEKLYMKIFFMKTNNFSFERPRYLYTRQCKDRGDFFTRTFNIKLFKILYPTFIRPYLEFSNTCVECFVKGEH